MRCLDKNKQKLYYALFQEGVPIYETDEDGNIISIIVDGEEVPVEIGVSEPTYSSPVEFYGNIALSGGGESETVEYGIDLASYNATLTVAKGYLPIDETSLIWHTTEVSDDPKTADYKVVKVSESLNSVKYLLQRIVK